MNIAATTNQTSASLTDADYRSLEASFIDRDLVAEARLRRVDDLEGSQIVGRTRNAGTNFAGIVFPYYLPGNSETVRDYRLRRDQPDMERDSKGELKAKAKYLSPPGRGNLMYFPRGVSEGDLADTSLPIVFVEGEKKALASARLAREGGNAFRFIPVGLPGVWNWRGTVGKSCDEKGNRIDVKGVIEDFDLITWKGRDVIILFDTNVHTNPSVGAARQGLARELAKRNANVLYAEMPPDCGVNGIDDYLALIESRDGIEAAIKVGIDLLRTATPYKDARPLFYEKPRPLDSVLQPVEPVETAWLPTVLREWLVPASRVIGCPLDFLVLSALAIAGSLIGSRVRVKPIRNSNWFVVPNLYAGIVGLPSTKKSPALDEARKPLLRLQSAARDSYASAKADYEIEAKYFEKADKDARSKSKTASEYKNKLAEITKPDKPVLRRFETNDATSQKMIQFLAENPNGLILMRDELTGWLKSLDADYDQSSRPFYLELWKGAITYDHARVSENREIILTSGTLSIIGGIQPSRLQQYISEAYSYDNADGFPQRFLFSYPDAKRKTKPPTPSDYEQMERGLEMACGVFKILSEKNLGGNAVSDSGDKFFPLMFDSEAQAAFDEWKDETESEATRLESEDEVFASFLYKLPKSCAAIALIFHCFENINAENFPDRISAQTMLQALAYNECMTTHARRVFALGENRIFALAQALMGKIRAQKLDDGFTARDVKRKGWSGLKDDAMVHEALTLLEEYGYLKVIDGERGRPTTRHFINPTIQTEAQDEVE